MKKQDEVVLSEKTLIPVSLLITIIGGVAWLTTIYSKANANEKAIVAIKKDMNAIKRIDIRLARIEGALNIKVPSNFNEVQE